MSPEARARQRIDELLGAAGWHVCDHKVADLHAARGVAIREFELAAGHGTADNLLYVDGRAAGVVEAKKEGATLTGVETLSARYATGLPAAPEQLQLIEADLNSSRESAGRAWPGRLVREWRFSRKV